MREGRRGLQLVSGLPRGLQCEVVVAARSASPAGRRRPAAPRAWRPWPGWRAACGAARKNQLLTQLDRTFPGLCLALADVLGTKVGRLVAAHFADPARLARLGPDRFREFAARRGVQASRRVAARLVEAARVALPTGQAVIARQILQADLALLGDLEAQIATAGERIAALLPATGYHVLTTTPGWGVTRAAAYAAALGPHSRWAAPPRSTARRGSPRRSTPQLGGAVTVPSAGKGRSTCAAP